MVPAITFEELVRRTEPGGDADVALMAIENTLAGSIIANYKLLNNSALTVDGEVFLRIVQNLMALPGQTITDLTEVHSHPMAIEQCRDFFRQYPHIRLIESEDTALSAKMIRDQNRSGIGAIASTLAAELYGLDILAPSIETNKKNHTRFLILRPRGQRKPAEGSDKVTITFSVGHTVGSLYKVLAVLAAYNINLTKIQSTPIIGSPWEYQFYIDFVTEGKVGYEHAIEAIRPLAHQLKVLGVYRQGTHYDF